ncbi:MAG: hypothetical protein N3A69_06615 [Leptospiraceae bacterium]|nr:hypothetical protein [Leptospiraceae bacterium]
MKLGIIMAKKRSKKIKIKKAVAKAKKSEVPTAKVAKETGETTPAQAEHILGFVGGILVVIAAVIAWLAFLRGGIFEWTYFASLILGILMVALTWHIPKMPRVSAIFLLVLSVFALVLPPNGFFVGPILGLIGAIIVLLRK